MWLNDHCTRLTIHSDVKKKMTVYVNDIYGQSMRFDS